MKSSLVQFQKGLSLTAFLRRYELTDLVAPRLRIGAHSAHTTSPLRVG